MKNYFESESPISDMFKDAWSTTPGKIVICTAGVFAFLGVSGLGFRVLAYTTSGFKSFTSALKS